ncbi:MAG: transporter substrate-binding domain-containing protein [Planctomycetaceae bacterium]|nr:transporter substrate-binding domain-containing protein [Planctomycetaceae bacterium]
MNHTVSSLWAAVSLARRDLLEFLRDRRTVAVTLLLPMITYPLVALSSSLGVRTGLQTTAEQQSATPLSLVLSGPESPRLATRLGMILLEAKENIPPGWPSDVFAEIESSDKAKQLLDSGKVDLWIDVPEGFSEQLTGFNTIDLTAHVSDEYPASTKTRAQLESLMQSFATQIREERMELAEVPRSFFNPIKLIFEGKDPAEVIADRRIIAPVLGAILVLLAVLTMTGSFYPAIDAIAGEKERGTIETLLIVPCRTQDIVFGKFLAIFGVTLATLAANVISILLTILVSLRYFPDGSAEYYLQNIWRGAFITLISFIGLSSVASAMSLAVTTASKSVKEAQNTLTPVILLISALAGISLLPGISINGFVPAVPFTGQIVVSQDALTPPPTEQQPITHDDQISSSWEMTTPIARLAPLLTTMLSSVGVTWVLLRGTAAMLTDEDILFRGPDAASGFARPAPRLVPGVIHGGLALAVGLAGLWYVQGISPANIVLAIPVQQVAVIAPLAMLLWWQRVNIQKTFSLSWPGTGSPWSSCLGGLSALLGGVLTGGGLFILGAAVLLQLTSIEMSPAMKQLSEKILSLMLDQPWWLAWILIAILPACLEELLFRGWVLSAFCGEKPNTQRMAFAVFAQAICFALFHLLPERMPQTFLLGLALGTIVLLTKSIYPAILCHVANNSMPLVLLFMTGIKDKESLPSSATTDTMNLSLPPLAIVAAGGVVVLGTILLIVSQRLRVKYSLRGFAAILLVSVFCQTNDSIRHLRAQEPATNETVDPLRVAVFPIKGLAEYQGDSPRGYSIDLWKELSKRIGESTQYVQIPSIEKLFNATQNGDIDVLLGPLAVTEQREKLVDFTHPVVHSGLQIAVPRDHDGRLFTALTHLISWELVTILASVIGTMILTGHLLWLFERRHNAESFPAPYPRGVWEAVWWSVSTIITGGCENKVISTITGRFIAVTWMIGGIVLVALLTSTLTTTMTVDQVTGTVRSPRDLFGKTVACQEGGVVIDAVKEYGGSPVLYPNIETMMTAVSSDECDALVSESHTLMLALHTSKPNDLRLIPGIFNSFDFALALPQGSTLREPLNNAILQMRETGILDDLKDRWFGEYH